jgi:hypothetical protein
MGSTIDIAALEAQVTAEEAAATAAELSEDERRAAELVARLNKAREDKAAADKTRRASDLTVREATARGVAGPRYLVRGIDLVDFFPLGTAPAPAQLPTGGVIIVRSPEPDRLNDAVSDIEHKRRPLGTILADLLCASVVDPDGADSAIGAAIRAFCDAYPGAATQAGDAVLQLGGMKSRSDKRGRA